MGVISHGGENLLDFLGLWLVLSTYDGGLVFMGQRWGQVAGTRFRGPSLRVVDGLLCRLLSFRRP